MQVCQIDRKWAKNLVNTGFCFDDCVKTIASAKGKHCEFEFIHCFDLEIDCGDKIMPEITEQGSRSECLEKYHGLRLIRKRYPEEISIEEIVSMVRGRPVILRVNSVYCPWDPSYGKKVMNEIDNTVHYFIIYDLSEDGNTLYCCDAYYNLTGLTIPVNKLPDMLYGAAYLEDVGKEQVLSAAEFKDKAEAILKTEGSHSVAKIFRILSDHMEKNWDRWRNQGRETCLELVETLCWEMVAFMQRGIYFANMADQYDNMKEIGEKFERLSELSERICTICLKCSKTGKLSDKILDAIRNILVFLATE